MKTVFIIFVVFGVSYVGYALSNYYKKRQRILSDAVLFCGCLISDIDFLHMPLKKIISARSGQFYPEFEKILSEYFKKLQRGEITDFKDCVQSLYLKKCESESLNSLFCELGKTDSDTQITTITNFKNIFENYSKDATDESKKYAPLCLKLGFLTGLAIAVILV